jgi:O-antigen ligase
MHFLFLLCSSYFCFLSWSKAGLAEDWSRDIRLFWSLLIILIFVWSKFTFIRQNYKAIIPIFGILSFFIISQTNPSYSSFNLINFQSINFKERISQSKSLEKINVVTNGLKLVANASRTNHSRGLTIFFDFKNRYKDRFNPSEDDDLWLLINDIEVSLRRSNLKFLPSIPVSDSYYYIHFYFILFHIFIGYIIFYLVKDFRKYLNYLMWIIFINCALLSLVGIVQKINYIPNDNALEILGIWDTPEPRYFFSTFTYKNHWCAFALSSLIIGFCLFYREVKYQGHEVFRSLKSMLIIMLCFPLIASIPYSGSRSGSFLLIIIIVSILILLIFKINFKKNNFIVLSYTISVLSIAFIFFSHFSKNGTFIEMKKNSISQLENMLQEKYPLRFYLWSDTLVQCKDRIWLGHGHQGYKTLNPQYQSHHVRSERSKGLANAHNPYIPLVAHAHSDFLEWLCDFGLIGVFIFVIPYLLFLFAVYLSSNSPTIRLLFISILLIYVMSLFDFPTRTPACLCLVAILHALITGFFHHYRKRDLGLHNTNF